MPTRRTSFGRWCSRCSAEGRSASVQVRRWQRSVLGISGGRKGGGGGSTGSRSGGGNDVSSIAVLGEEGVESLNLVRAGAVSARLGCRAEVRAAAALGAGVIGSTGGVGGSAGEAGIEAGRDADLKGERQLAAASPKCHSWLDTPWTSSSGGDIHQDWIEEK